MKKQMYKITVDQWIVEGRASSIGNACRLAFKKLIEAGLIKNQPPTDIDSPTGFKNVKVEVLNDY